MRRGKHPKDAAMEALRRVKANTVEKRLLNERGLGVRVELYALNARASTRACRCTARTRPMPSAPRTVPSVPLEAFLDGNATD
jgi:hypothetical protein